MPTAAPAASAWRRRRAVTDPAVCAAGCPRIWTGRPGPGRRPDIVGHDAQRRPGTAVVWGRRLRGSGTHDGPAGAPPARAPRRQWVARPAKPRLGALLSWDDCRVEGRANGLRSSVMALAWASC